MRRPTLTGGFFIGLTLALCLIVVYDNRHNTLMARKRSLDIKINGKQLALLHYKSKVWSIGRLAKKYNISNQSVCYYLKKWRKYASEGL